MSKSIIYSAIFGTLSVTLMQYAQAQDAGALQRELQLQLERQAPVKPPEPPKSQEIKESNPKEQKELVKAYTLSGNTLITDGPIQTAIQQWINKEISLGDLKDVSVEIQELYGNN